MQVIPTKSEVIKSGIVTAASLAFLTGWTFSRRFRFGIDEILQTLFRTTLNSSFQGKYLMVNPWPARIVWVVPSLIFAHDSLVFCEVWLHQARNSHGRSKRIADLSIVLVFSSGSIYTIGLLSLKRFEGGRVMPFISMAAIVFNYILKVTTFRLSAKLSQNYRSELPPSFTRFVYQVKKYTAFPGQGLFKFLGGESPLAVEDSSDEDEL